MGSYIPNRSEIIVFWDINDCPVPENLSATDVSENIETALKNMGYRGRITIRPFGYLDPEKKDDFEGFDVFSIPKGERERRHNMILATFLTSVIARRKNLMLIIGDISQHLGLNMAIQAMKTKSNYSIFLAQPEKPSDVLLDSVRREWIWTSLAMGGETISTQNYIMASSSSTSNDTEELVKLFTYSSLISKPTEKDKAMQYNKVTEEELDRIIKVRDLISLPQDAEIKGRKKPDLLKQCVREAKMYLGKEEDDQYADVRGCVSMLSRSDFAKSMGISDDFMNAKTICFWDMWSAPIPNDFNDFGDIAKNIRNGMCNFQRFGLVHEIFVFAEESTLTKEIKAAFNLQNFKIVDCQPAGPRQKRTEDKKITTMALERAYDYYSEHNELVNVLLMSGNVDIVYTARALNQIKFLSVVVAHGEIVTEKLIKKKKTDRNKDRYERGRYENFITGDPKYTHIP